MNLKVYLVFNDSLIQWFPHQQWRQNDLRNPVKILLGSPYWHDLHPRLSQRSQWKDSCLLPSTFFTKMTSPPSFICPINFGQNHMNAYLKNPQEKNLPHVCAFAKFSINIKVTKIILLNFARSTSTVSHSICCLLAPQTSALSLFLFGSKSAWPMQDLGGQSCALNHHITHPTVNIHLPVVLKDYFVLLEIRALLQCAVTAGRCKVSGFLFLVKLHFLVLCTSQIPCAFRQAFIKARGG